MLMLIIYVVLIILVTIGVVKLIDLIVPQKLKPFLSFVFILLSGFMGYKIYDSINGPIAFDKVKKERYAQVITKLKDIRDAQQAHRSVTGSYAKDFNSLVKFIDTAQFTIIERRDSSYMEYNTTYRIDMLKEVVVVDTLGFVSVKDSLFGTDDRYNSMMNVPDFGSGKQAQFEMKTDILEQSAGYKAPVFEAKVAKDIVLHDQPKSLLAQEKELVSVEGVDGPAIAVGSLTEVSTNGNWPTIYDKQGN